MSYSRTTMSTTQKLSYNSCRLTKTRQQRNGKTLPGLMSLDFCWNTQMLGSETETDSSGCRCYDGAYIFLLNSGPVPNEHHLIATVSPSIAVDHVHLFITTVYPSSKNIVSSKIRVPQISKHLKLVSWTWQLVHCIQWPHQISGQ